MPAAVCQHGCRGQGNLWEDPGAGLPWNGAPPAVSGQPGVSPAPKPGQPPREPPVAAAFNMDDELLELEQQTKVHWPPEPSFGTYNSLATRFCFDDQGIVAAVCLIYV